MQTYRVTVYFDARQDVGFRDLIDGNSAAEVISAVQRDFPDAYVIRARKAAVREPTSEEIKELWDLYWTTKIPAKEIVEAYNGIVETVQEIAKVAGPFLLERRCDKCGGDRYARSRTHRDLERDFERRYVERICDPCRDARFADTQAFIQAETVQANRRIHELKTMPYPEYLKTPEWTETRKLALRRANYRCQTCNKDGLLNVHHRTYVRRGHEYSNDLTVLCESCHQIFHDKAKLIRE